jgi:GMP synthase (glutamine-hydrolysing)
MKILIIDNAMERDSWGSDELRHYARAVQGATIAVRRAPLDDLPASPREFDRIILSGSGTSCMADAPWIEKLHEFIRTSINEKKALLGVCFGHQSLVRALGGKTLMRKAAKPEHGWTRIALTADAPIFKSLPKTFYTFSSHFEEVSDLPKAMKNLARSDDCQFQACQLGNLPVYGVQFHPERNIANALKTFEERKKAGGAKLLLHPNETEKLYNPKVGETIFSNFLGDSLHPTVNG